MRTDKTIRQIWLTWALIGGFAVIMVACIVLNLYNGEKSNALIGIGGISFGVALFFFSRYRQNSVIAKLFRQPTMDPLVNHFLKGLGHNEMADAALTYGAALSAAYYGEFVRAEQILFSVGWEGRGRIQEAYQFAAEAHLYYWRDRNYREGLSLARRAQELGTVTSSLPGSGTTNLGYSAIVALGEVLTGSQDQEALAMLESAHRKLPILGRLLAAWGLAIWHQCAGDTNKSSAYLAEIRRAAPYCTPLLTLPDPPTNSRRSG